MKRMKRESKRVVNVGIDEKVIAACINKLTIVRLRAGDTTPATRPAAVRWAAEVVARMSVESISETGVTK